MSNMIALLGALIMNEELQQNFMQKSTTTLTTTQPQTTQTDTTTSQTTTIQQTTTSAEPLLQTTSTEPAQQQTSTNSTTPQQTDTNPTTPSSITTQQPATQSDTQTTTPQQQDQVINQTSPATSTTKQVETYPYTCPLCLEEFYHRKQLYRIVGCRHLYCQSCILTYYSQCIKDHKSQVKCPSPACETLIQFCNVKNLLPNETLLACQRIALKAPHNQNKSSIWCPGKDCKAKITRQKTNKVINGVVQCQKCKLRVCFKCGEWEHTGTPCDEAEVLTDKKIESENMQREAFEKWKKECGVVLKGCPACGAVIERTSGCSHMNCRACQHQFCFVCLVPCKGTHCR